MTTADLVDRPRGVYLTAIVITQDTFRDERGRTHLIGIFDRLSTQSFPLTAEFMVWCNIKGHGTGTIHLRLIDAESAALLTTDPLVVEVTPFKGHEWFLTVRTTFPSAGLYKLVALVDNEPQLEVPLMVWQTGETAPATEPASEGVPDE